MVQPQPALPGTEAEGSDHVTTGQSTLLAWFFVPALLAFFVMLTYCIRPT